MGLFASIRRLFRRRPTPVTPEVLPPTEDARPAPPADSIPPGLRPLVIKTQVAEIPGLQPMRFVRKVTVLRDDQRAKYESLEVTRIVLRGCGCLASGPDDVAYLSDITGLPVCVRCAKTCICGHKVAPSERVQIEPRLYMCSVCHAMLQKEERRRRFWRTLFGPFIRE